MGRQGECLVQAGILFPCVAVTWGKFPGKEADPRAGASVWERKSKGQKCHQQVCPFLQ
jgi:hypothetical protein